MYGWSSATEYDLNGSLPVFSRSANAEITIQGITISTDPRPEGTGYFQLDSWEGWESGADSSNAVVDWEASDGGVFDEVYMSGRAITLTGSIMAGSLPELMDMHEELQGLLTRPRIDWLTVHEDRRGFARQILVQRAEPPRVQMATPRSSAFTLSLRSADWRRLDVTAQSKLVSVGGTALVNSGTAPASLTLSIIGPLTNPGISWPGYAWQYSGTVAAGQTLVVDMDTRRVQDPATTTQYRAKAAGAWLSLPPGSTTVTRTGSGAGHIDASWRSSWS